MDKIVNHGLIVKPITTREEGAEHILGATEKIINPSGDWSAWPVDKEPQSKNGVETQSCTAYGSLSSIETLLKFKGHVANYSDRYLAICANIDPYAGADPHTTIEAIRNVAGCLPEAKLPFSDDLTSVEDYFKPKPMTDELLSEGKGWWSNWTLRHKWVWSGSPTPQEKRELLKNALKTGTVCVSVLAWKQRNDGLYWKYPAESDGHWVELVKYDENGNPEIFDSYADGEGDPFLKTLIPDYNFQIAKVFYLTPVLKTEPTAEQLSIFQKIVNLLAQIVGLQAVYVKKVLEERKPITQPDETLPPPVEPPENIQGIAVKICKEVGLSEEMTERLLKTIQLESGWNPKALNINTNGSYDAGICQFNSTYWIGKGKLFPSKEYIFANPEKCILEMAKLFKAGKAHYWVVYKKLYPNG